MSHRSYTRFNPVATFVNTTATMVLRRDPKRRSFIIQNNGSNSGYVAPSAEVSAGRGILITNGSRFEMTETDHFDLVKDEWWALSLTAGGTWFFLETITLPEQYLEEYN